MLTKNYSYLTTTSGQTSLVSSLSYSGCSSYNYTYTYDAWGNPISTSSNGTAEANIIQNNPLRYRGYIYDAETGFYYLLSRYYDPAICRFINADGTSYLGANGDFQSFNLYAYCSNNPVMGFDPTGNWDWETVKNSAKSCIKTAFSFVDGIIDWGEKALSYIDLTFSAGSSVSFGLGIFQVSAGPSVAFDTKGNIDLQYTFSWTISTGGGFGLNSGGIYYMITNCPETSKLKDESSLLGGTINALIENIPVFAGIDGYLIPDKQNGGYFGGFSKNLGVSTSYSGLFEFHGGSGYTLSVKNVNTFEMWNNIYSKVKEW